MKNELIWGNFSTLKNKIYFPADISEVLKITVSESYLITTNKKIKYYNIPCAFDIETSSFYDNEKKVAIMYEWTMGINGAVIIGRTWNELETVINTIVTELNLSSDKRLIFYVHNLAFEFQFLRSHFQWKQIFALDERKPDYAVAESGIEYRCSYLLSGYSLAKLGEQLRKYPVAKMVGDLDYKLLRHSETPLTETELKYCENDVRVVMSYIQETIETDGGITRIPLTKTGYVRNYCRNCCLYDGSHRKNTNKFIKYHRLMQSLTLDYDEYAQLKRAFQGGFTHANAQYTGKILYDIGSFDFTSSYPYVMLSEKFPMSHGEVVKISGQPEFEKYLKNYCCLFDIEIFNIISTTLVEHPLSSSRCWQKNTAVEDNGRIVSAEHLVTTITELDYETLCYFYKWDDIHIYNFRIYKKDYLPVDFAKAIIKLYKDKTELKGIEEKVIEYLVSKGMLNASYGMTVTDICRDDIIYESEWSKSAPDIKEQITLYNISKRRFLFYPWGVWVTAYARSNLFTGIKAFSGDYVYSDTDSIKCRNAEKHADYIQWYNNTVKQKLQAAAVHFGVDFSEFEPKTIEGKPKLLGVWDDEGTYSRFKTLGAKRYMTEKNGKINITVSGVNKSVTMPYLMKKYGMNVFEEFSDDLYIPAEYTGKMTHTYIDEPRDGVLTDYTGIKAEYHERTAVHLENADYTLSLSGAYADYLKGVDTIEN